MSEQDGLERSATDELRRLLDERGIEWEDGGEGLTIIPAQDGVPRAWTVNTWPSGKDMGDCLWVQNRHPLTPEQAIAATLGADAKPTQAESSGTCEMEYVSDFMSWHCKACDQMDMAPRNPKPRYCKWCGRKVVGE